MPGIFQIHPKHSGCKTRGRGNPSGSGLPSIHAVWQKQRWKTPEITESFGPDRTSLLLPLVSEKAAIKVGDKKVAIKSGDKPGRIAEARKAEILQYLTDTPQATSSEIARAIGLQASGTRKYLSELAAEGAVVAEGANKGRRYRLKA